MTLICRSYEYCRRKDIRKHRLLDKLFGLNCFRRSLQTLMRSTVALDEVDTRLNRLLNADNLQHVIEEEISPIPSRSALPDRAYRMAA